MIFNKLILFGTLLLTANARKGRKKYDYIIAGGGTAGCVLAGRLSEDPHVSVLLLEAGEKPTDPFIPIPKTFLDTFLNPDIHWGYMNEPQEFTGPGKRTMVSVAKLLGGASSHNGQVYIRGSPHDFNNWAKKYGNKGWSYEDVLPYFKKSEVMADQDLANNGFHGTKGPLTTRLGHHEEIIEDVVNGAVDMGFQELSDYNGPEMEGVGRVQVMVDQKGQRMNTYEAFVKPVLARRNLVVKTGALVTKVKIVKTKKSFIATGVHVNINGKNVFIKASKEVIVSGGAINSPKLLMLSGIGPEQHLKDKQVDFKVDLPVGKNLQDHMAASVKLNIDNAVPRKITKIFTFEALFEYIFTGNGPWASVSSVALLFQKAPHQPKKDLFPHIEQMFQMPFIKFDDELAESIRNGSGISPEKLNELQESENGPGLFEVNTLILHPKSRGTVMLQSNKPMTHPIINYPYFDNQFDIRTFIEGIRLVQRVLKSSKVDYLSLPGPHPACTDEIFDSDDYWRCYLKQTLHSFQHYVGTCSMANDKSGVVDHRLRVKGVKRLRVVDASIMPEELSSQTSSATIMIAEKAADMIKADSKY